MDDTPRFPPNVNHHYMDQRLASVRAAGRDLRFVVRGKDRARYELGVQYVDERGDPQRQWLMVDKNREKLEQIRLAFEAQERRGS